MPGHRDTIVRRRARRPETLSLDLPEPVVPGNPALLQETMAEMIAERITVQQREALLWLVPGNGWQSESGWLHDTLFGLSQYQFHGDMTGRLVRNRFGDRKWPDWQLTPLGVRVRELLLEKVPAPTASL